MATVRSRVTGRRALWGAVAFAFWASAAPAQEPTTSLSGYAPRETKFFAELQYLQQLQKMLVDSGTWEALLHLASRSEGEKPAAEQWTRRIEAEFGVSLDELIDSLFGEQVAVAAPNMNRLSEAVVIARVTNPSYLERLIKRRSPVPKQTQGRVTIYQLSQGLWLATDGRIAVLGPPGREGRFFEQAANLLSGETRGSLADSPAFVEQLSELPGGKLGLLYLEIPEPKGKQPGQKNATEQEALPAWWPATWPILRRSAMGMYSSGDGKGLDLALRGQVDKPPPARVMGGVSPSLLNRLPRSTLAAWCFSLDYLSVYKRAMHPQENEAADVKRLLLELARTWLQNQSLEEMLIRHLGQETIVVLGQEAASAEQLGEGFDRPLLSIMVKVKDPKVVAEAVGELMNTLVNVQNLLITARTRNLRPKEKVAPVSLLKIRPEEYKKVMIWRIPWGELLRQSYRCPFLATVQVSWSVFDDWLVLSTDPVHIKQLIDAHRAEEGTGFGATAAFQSLGGETEALSIAAFQPAEGARMIESLLDYLQQSHPQVLQPNWWQNVFRGTRVELGIGIKNDPNESGVLLVDRVLPGMPASGKLRAGDRIEAIDKQTLDLRYPLASFKELMANRKDADEVLVRFRRGRKRMERIIKIPGARANRTSFDPVRALQDLTIIGQPFSAWAYSVSGQEPEKFDARMMLRFEGQEREAPGGGNRPTLAKPKANGRKEQDRRQGTPEQKDPEKQPKG